MKFQKKPVVIEAFQVTREHRASNAEWPSWLHEAWQKDSSEPGSVCPRDYPDSDGTDPLVIRTLEGIMSVDWGDWIIRGVKGELYPCKPDIFEATYQAAGTASLFDHVQELTAAGYRVEFKRGKILITEDLNGSSVDNFECSIDAHYWTKEEGLRVIVETLRKSFGI